MKNFIFQVFLLFLILIFAKIDLKAMNECDSGWVQVYKDSIPIVVEDDTCLYNLWLCIRCDAGTNPVPFEVKLSCHGPVNNDCILDIAEVIQKIENMITDPNWIDDNISDDCFAGTGPCDPYYPATFKELIGNIPVCWKKFNFIDEDEESHILYIGCDDLMCITTYKYCWNGSDYERILWDGPDLVGSGNCLNQEPSDPLPGLFTGCFYIPGDCWP